MADSLEADWNQKLRVLAEARQEYERQRQADQVMLSEEQRAQILALATDFPRLWRDTRTPDRERKRMVRLLLEDVTLHKGAQLTVQIRFKGGVQQVLTLPVPVQNFQARKTSPHVIAEIDWLLDHHNYREIAAILNQRGLHSGVGLPFDAVAVGFVRRNYGLKTRYDRLREQGLLTLSETAKALGICKDMVKEWRRLGLLKGYEYNDIHQCLYQDPGPDPPQKAQGAIRRWKRVRWPEPKKRPKRGTNHRLRRRKWIERTVCLLKMSLDLKPLMLSAPVVKLPFPCTT